MTRVFVWGAGRCGRSLCGALAAAGHEVVGTWNRTAEAAARGGPRSWPTFSGDDLPAAVAEAEVVWLAVTDARIAEAAARVLQPHHVALHAAGAVPARVLRVGPSTPRSVASCHPLQSFAADRSPPAHVAAATFGIEGEPEAVAAAQALVASMGARSFVVSDETGKALYHAACCLASNALVALADRAVNVFAAAGVTREEALRALAPLIRGTAENLASAAEPRDVLTGPIHRGDLDVVQAHLRAIAERAPAELDAYIAQSLEIARLVPGSEAPRLLNQRKRSPRRRHTSARSA